MAEGLNRVMLLGNLCADPDLRFTQAGQAVLNCRLATNESYLDKDRVRRERTDYHTVVVWGKRGEALAKFLTKGSSLFIEGSIRTSSYDDREGQKRYKTEIVANNVVLCGKSSGAGGGGGGDHGEDDPGTAGAGGEGGGRPAPRPRPGDDPRVPFSPRNWKGKDFKGSNFSSCPPDFLRMLAETLNYMADNPQDGKEQYADRNRKDAATALVWANHKGAGGGDSSGAPRGGGGGGGRGGSTQRQPAPPADDGGGGGGDYGGDYGGGGSDDDIPF